MEKVFGSDRKSDECEVRRRLVIWGASGHALVVAAIIRARGDFEVYGFLDDLDNTRYGEEFCGASILGGKEQLDRLPQLRIQHLILGFGNCEARLRLGVLLREKGFFLVTAVHPRATVAPDVLIGAGTVIAAGAVVNPNSRIGDNVIINTASSVDHECVVEDGAHICPGTHLAGGVRIGRGAWIGIGATIIDRISIGAGSIIGAGAVVTRDIPDNAVAYGVPARIVRRKT